MSENGKQKSTCNNQEYFYSVLRKGSTFFQAKSKTDEHWHFFKRFADIKTLWPQFQYVFSDMNCWSTHLLAYLKAKWLMHDETRLERLSKKSKETEETKDSFFFTLVISLWTILAFNGTSFILESSPRTYSTGNPIGITCTNVFARSI